MTTTRDSITDLWGSRTPFHGEGQWPVRVDERTTSEPEHWVQSACVLCSNGCACDIGVRDGKIVGVRGRAEDISNKGRLGPKGLHGWEANHSADRLTTPLMRRDGVLVPATWQDAMLAVVRQAMMVRNDHGASAVGFYTTGQLMLEEYYTLSLIGKAGFGTPHMDGNTRLCTATAAAALRESFGCDGQPGSYFDIDVTDCLLLVGHNMPTTNTVLWSRVLDRRAGPNPPRLLVIDPRRTVAARDADIHLAPRLGTNVAVLNGLLHLMFAGGWQDEDFIRDRTIGIEALRRVVGPYTPDRVEEISGVPAAQLRAAAEMIGSSKMLVSSCLQGVYQSNQATAAAVQINNLSLVLGRIGREGCGILQMNGQPTAQNTRETGADAHMPGFRNWQNPAHIEELARIWNVEPHTIPHWQPPTHAMEIFRLCEIGSIRFLWIQCTNPAVSLPHLDRVRAILRRQDLFVVVQDAFLTETAQLADVVLPAAIWGEKTGTFTNADRTVHISHKAVEPPGEARPDFEIFLEFARLMDFRDKDGAPLIKWRTPQECFEAWKVCSRGRPCDYSGLSYEKLSAGSGVRWPCNEANPEGAARLYSDLRFPTEPHECESYGHDLLTGALHRRQQYAAMQPRGRAILKAAEYVAPAEQPDQQYPFLLTTGRLVHHFHTRTKTARSQPLADAAADGRIEIAAEDAARLSVQEGDWLRVASRRGTVEARASVAEIAPGELFLPLHFGYWDQPQRARAANEITRFEWDPVSKQPQYKYAAVSVTKIAGPTTRQPQQMGSAANPGAGGAGSNTVVGKAKEVVHAVSALRPRRRHVADYLSMLIENEQRLVEAFGEVRGRHAMEADVWRMLGLFAEWAGEGGRVLRPFQREFGTNSDRNSKRLHEALPGLRSPLLFDLVRDLQDLWLLLQHGSMTAELLECAARSLRAQDLVASLAELQRKRLQMTEWIQTRLRETAAQALAVPG